MNQFLQTLNGYTLTEDKNAPTVVSFFSGGGGLDLGLSLAGFRTAYASDLEKQHCETLQNNFPNAVIEAADINDSTGDHIRQITGINQFDLMAVVLHARRSVSLASARRVQTLEGCSFISMFACLTSFSLARSCSKTFLAF